MVHDSPDGITSGYIVETEAYMSSDAASHSFRGKTPRTEIMFGPPGFLYVYFTYGMHYCVNIVAGPDGSGEAVLIRALQPVDGVDLMKKRRGLLKTSQLTNGPAKLAQAMGFDRRHNGEFVLASSSPIRIEPGIKPAKIVSSPRIGITKETDKPWRFYIADNTYVSHL